MRKYDIETGTILEMIKCNQCGKQIKVENGIVKEGVFSSEYNWGYFSEKDNQKHIFDLCENCYEDIINKFTIPVEEKENVELL